MGGLEEYEIISLLMGSWAVCPLVGADQSPGPSDQSVYIGGRLYLFSSSRGISALA